MTKKADFNPRCITQGKITHEGETFVWVAFRHESGRGYSYNLQIDADDPKDVVHMDTKRDTVFRKNDLITLREYWKLIRNRPKANT